MKLFSPVFSAVCVFRWFVVVGIVPIPAIEVDFSVCFIGISDDQGKPRAVW
ncbi:MAG: hypothetical protein IPP71_07510 [Bacteroidetes bacterium]|nr:hypothetical protein [Bacteroidota bacterium]